jgi:hypothetical protein
VDAGFAVRASEPLPLAIASLEDGIARGADLETLRALAATAATAWVDAVLHGFVGALATAVRGASSGQRSIALARAVADRIVAQGARRAERAAIDAVIAFLAEHVAVLPEGPAIVFPIDDALAAAIGPALATHGAELPARVGVAMHATIDRALHHLFDVPVGLLGMGAMARAAIAVGRAGLAARAHRGVDGAITAPDAADRLARFLAQSIAQRGA